MLYPEYDQIEICLGSVKARGKIISPSKVSTYYGTKETYMSAGRYKSMKDHMSKNDGKVRGFDGEVWYDFIIIDIDELSAKSVLLFIQHLEINYKIPINNLRIYFSGSKGFHVLIPTILFGLEPGKKLNKTIEKIVGILAKNIIKYDTSLYDKNQVYRLHHTMHQKTDLFKIPLIHTELRMGIDYIKKLAITSRQNAFDRYPYLVDSVDVLVELSNKIQGVEGKTTPSPPADIMKKHGDVNLETEHMSCIPDRSKLCIYSLLNGVSKGTADGHPGRDESAIRVANHYKRAGLPFEVVQGLMYGWNRLNNPPMLDTEISNKVLSVFRSEFEYGCNDSVLNTHCHPDCYLFNR